MLLASFLCSARVCGTCCVSLSKVIRRHRILIYAMVRVYNSRPPAATRHVDRTSSELNLNLASVYLYACHIEKHTMSGMNTDTP